MGGEIFAIIRSMERLLGYMAQESFWQGAGSPLAFLPDIWLDPELDVLGFYVPFAMVIVTAGFLLAWLIAWIFDVLGLTRFVWHPPLFLFAMMIACCAALGLWLFPR